MSPSEMVAALEVSAMGPSLGFNLNLLPAEAREIAAWIKQAATEISHKKEREILEH